MHRRGGGNILPTGSRPPRAADIIAAGSTTTPNNGEAPKTEPPAPKRMTKRESTTHLIFWLISFPKRSLLPGLRIPVLVNVAWASVVAYMYSKGMFTQFDATAHTYVGGPLGFLLAFRCSAGLARCDSGREVSVVRERYIQVSK